jgi:ketosteroid isomerase-like protein
VRRSAFARFVWIFAALALVLAPVAARFASAQGVPSRRPDTAKLQALVEAERSFAQSAKVMGTKEAFLTWLADSAVIFQPLPENGKQSWKNRQPSKSMITWEPDFAEISASGDLGVTSGPWRFYPADTPGIPAAWGMFISVWRPQSNGGWQVVADIGVQHSRPYRSVGSSPLDLGPAHEAAPAAARLATPAQLDAALSSATRSRGISKGYAQVATHDFRFHRDGAWRYDRPADAYAWMDSIPGRLELSPGGGGASSSNDFAYTWGTAVRYAPKATAPADTSVYLNVWRRESGGWKLSLAVLNPAR